MVPFNPQPIEVLKARFPAAIAKSYSVQHVSENPEDRPGSRPEHVFDFEDGVRLIVSRDFHNGREVIHFSGSLMQGAGFYLRGKLDKGSTLGLMRAHFFHISGIETERHHFICFSDGGVPHWCVPFTNLN